MLTELKNHGTMDACIVFCDGLKGLPEAISPIWPLAVEQTCVVHLALNSLVYSARQRWQTFTRYLRANYTAATFYRASDRFA